MRNYLRQSVVLAMIGLLLCNSATLFAHQAADDKAKDKKKGVIAYQEQPNIPSEKRGGARWGANYFPNIALVNQDGKAVRFFDDLIKDKVVIIYFMYTSCQDTCPLETARLVNVQRILGDRVGKDVFMYSITVDPANDTPEVLKKYAEKFNVGPGWQFLTGDEADITLLRTKLGLYSADIGDDLTDHNISLLLGNQRTGRWMKRSPFDNPYFLAEQVGNWLVNWKQASPSKISIYAETPKPRTFSLGETLFRGRCIACHNIGEKNPDARLENVQLTGPDLLGVTQKRERAWLARLLTEPDKMLADQDPEFMELYARYNNIMMPNFRLSKVDVDALLDYLDSESLRQVNATTSK